MGVSQEEKSKGSYYGWSPEEKKTLLSLLVDAANQNLCDASGSFNKHIVEQRILPALNKSCGSMIIHNHYKNRMRILKNRYKIFVDLLRHSSGFGWDLVTKISLHEKTYGRTTSRDVLNTKIYVMIRSKIVKT